MSKKETIKTREHLQKAMNELSYHDDVREVKAFIQKALTALEAVDRRRGNRVEQQQQTPHDKWMFDQQLGLINPLTAKLTMRALDGMIADENKKLAEFRARIAEQKKGQVILG